MTHRNIAPAGVCLAAIVAVLATPAAAQSDPTAATNAPSPVVSDEGSSDIDEIVVVADSLFGEVDAGVPPIDELDEGEIAAYGASSIADLVEALAPQTGSGRGRGSGPPVFLVNGMRVSSFREMRSYPPEALQKVEILPEEVAQRYGFPPDQRVINFILKPNFASYEVEGEYEQPGIGGYHRKEAEATMLKLTRNSRLNFNVEIQDTTPLTEADRGIIQADGSEPDVATDPDPADYRTLIADSRDLEFTGNFTTALGDSGTSLSINGTAERSDSLSLSGLDSVVLTDPAGNSALRTFNADNPLEVQTATTTFSLGSTLNSTVGDWQMTGTVNASHAKTTQEIDQRADTTALVDAASAGDLAIDGNLPSIAPGGIDIAETITKSANTKWTMMGRPLLLPGGEVSVTADAGYDWLQLDSEDTRQTTGPTRLTRGNVNGGINVAVPITSRREGFGEGFGDITANFSAGVDYLSDFGTLTDWSTGLSWGITETLNLQATYIAKDAAPSLGQLGNPEIVSYNVPYYDLSRNETVLVTTVSGGNPFLTEEKQRDLRVAAFWETPIGATLSVEYNRNNSSDVTASFPQLTPEVEAAFPDRVERDASGTLTALDLRPVTFAEQKSSRLRFGINFSGPLGKARPQEAATSSAAPSPAASAQAEGGAVAGFRGPAGGFDPARFQQMRAQLCGENYDPQTAAPLSEEQIAALPPQMLERMRGQDGQIDQERLKQARDRICTGQGGGFDPERFQQLRLRFCGENFDPNSEVAMTEEQIAALPEQVQAQLRGTDGKLDPAKVKALRDRFCSQEAPGAVVAAGGQGGAPQGAGGPPPGGAGGPRGGGRGPGGFGPGGGDGRGRWFGNLTYTRELTNEVLIAPGMEVLDQLDGQSLSGSGTPRDTAQFVGGMFYRGLGVRASANYTGSTTIDGTGLPGSTDLHFGDLATLDLRFFVNIGGEGVVPVDKGSVLDGVRVAFVLDNVFDARRKVTDSDGETPLRYQPLLMDPTGRYIGIDIRKVF